MRGFEPELPLDPPEPRNQVGCCESCQEAIVLGEEVYMMGETLVHEDCFMEYALQAFQPTRVYAGE